MSSGLDMDVAHKKYSTSSGRDHVYSSSISAGDTGRLQKVSIRAHVQKIIAEFEEMLDWR